MAGPCDTCHAGCCRSYHLFITPFDALHIARTVGLPLGEFVTLLYFSEEEARRYEAEYPAVTFTDHPGKFFLLALNRVESALYPGTKRCHFLTEWKRQTDAPGREGHPGRHTVGRCSIYGARPMVCRAYPTRLHEKMPVGFIAQPPPPTAAGAHEILALCPEEWTVEKLGSDPTSVLHLLATQRFERDFYWQAIREFNEAQLPLAEYFPFMKRVYAHRLRVEPPPG